MKTEQPQETSANNVLPENIYYGIIHGTREFFMEKDGEIYGHEYNSRKKRFDWYPTVMDGKRRMCLKKVKNYAELIGLLNARKVI